MCTHCELSEAVYECKQCDAHLSYFCSARCFEKDHRKVTDNDQHIMLEMNPAYDTCDGPFSDCFGEISDLQTTNQLIVWW